MALRTHKPSGIATRPEDNAYMSELHPNGLTINHEHSVLLSIHHALIAFFLAMFSRSCNIHRASSGKIKISEGAKSLQCKTLS